MKGTSNIPLILGIIGAVLMLPGLACVACIGDVALLAGQAGMAVGAYVFGILPIVTGIIGGIKGKPDPKVSMILLIVSAIAALVGWFFTLYTSTYHLLALVAFVIGAIFARVQKMEAAEEKA